MFSVEVCHICQILIHLFVVTLQMIDKLFEWESVYDSPEQKERWRRTDGRFLDVLNLKKKVT